MKYNQMTTTEINQKVRELSAILESFPSDEVWDKTYREYCTLNAILDERYRVENQAEFDAFYREHIEGRSWSEINPDDWDYYSDWHKDMYGYRPMLIQRGA